MHMLRTTASLLVTVPLALLVGCGGGTGPEETPAGVYTEPEVIDFGYQEAGSTSGNIDFQIVNGTSGDIELLAIRPAGSSEFGIFAQPSLPKTMSAGNNETVSVYFYPSSEGEFVDYIEIETDDSDNSVIEVWLGGCSTSEDCTVDIEVPGDDDDSGNGGGDDDDDATGVGEITVSPGNVSFGDVPANSGTIGDVIQINNVGTGPLTVEAPTVGGTDAALFTVSGFNGGTLQPGGAPINLNLQFNTVGTELGARSASIEIASDDPDEPTVSIPISANVIEDCGACNPELSVLGAQPDSMGLGVVFVPVTMADPSVTVQNIGYGTLDINQVTEGGQFLPDNPDIAYDEGLPLSLNSGDSGVVTFTAAAAGCEVVNFDGVYAFTLGVDVTDAFGCLGGMGGK